jgi:hypothetical protein
LSQFEYWCYRGLKDDKGQSKQEYKQTQLIKIAKSWARGGTYVSLPKQWLNKFVNMMLTDDITEFIDDKPVKGNERGLVYATVKQEWEGKQVLVTLVTNDEKETDKGKEKERPVSILHVLAATRKDSEPKKEEVYDPSEAYKKRLAEIDHNNIPV